MTSFVTPMKMSPQIDKENMVHPSNSPRKPLRSSSEGFLSPTGKDSVAKADSPSSSKRMLAWGADDKKARKALGTISGQQAYMAGKVAGPGIEMASPDPMSKFHEGRGVMMVISPRTSPRKVYPASPLSVAPSNYSTKGGNNTSFSNSSANAPVIYGSNVTMASPDPMSKFHEGPGGLRMMTPSPSHIRTSRLQVPDIHGYGVVMESPDPLSKHHDGPGKLRIAYNSNDDTHHHSKHLPPRSPVIPHLYGANVTMDSPDPLSKHHDARDSLVTGNTQSSAHRVLLAAQQLLSCNNNPSPPAPREISRTEGSQYSRRPGTISPPAVTAPATSTNSSINGSHEADRKYIKQISPDSVAMASYSSSFDEHVPVDGPVVGNQVLLVPHPPSMPNKPKRNETSKAPARSRYSRREPESEPEPDVIEENLPDPDSIVTEGIELETISLVVASDLFPDSASTIEVDHESASNYAEEPSSKNAVKTEEEEVEVAKEEREVSSVDIGKDLRKEPLPASSFRKHSKKIKLWRKKYEPQLQSLPEEVEVYLGLPKWAADFIHRSPNFNQDSDVYQEWMSSQSVDVCNAVEDLDDVFKALHDKDFRTFKNLIEENNDVLESVDIYGNSILITAAFLGFRKVVRYLIRKGSNLDDSNFNGNTALHFAKELGHLEITDYLLKKGASQEVENCMGNTFIERIFVRGGGVE